MNQLSTSKHCLFFCCCKLGNKKKFQKQRQKYCYDIGCTAACCFCVFSPFTFPSVPCILESLGNGNRHLLLARSTTYLKPQRPQLS